jgi:hypothetical protein
MDELIAWAHVPISQAVLNGETHEDWYPLSGKQGEGLEGMINLVLSYSVSNIVHRGGILCAHCTVWSYLKYKSLFSFNLIFE